MSKNYREDEQEEEWLKFDTQLRTEGMALFEKKSVPVAEMVEQAGVEADTAEQVAKCRCGYSRGHHLIQPSYSYGTIALYLMLIGISSVPKRVIWRCIACKDPVEVITDPELLKRYRYREG